MTIAKFLTALTAVALLTTGCANQKAPATQALTSAEAAVDAVRDQAAKYAPEALASVDSTLSGLKEKLTSGDYKAVLAGAPQLMTAVDSLKETVSAKQAEMAAALSSEWSSLSSDVPQMVAAIQSRVDILSKSPKLPKNLEKAAFDGAKSGLDTMKATWDEASAAFASGDTGVAVEKARMVKDKGQEVLKMLGMSAG